MGILVVSLVWFRKARCGRIACAQSVRILLTRVCSVLDCCCCHAQGKEIEGGEEEAMIDATDDLCAKLWRLLESGNLQSVSDALSEHANEPNICPNATSVGCKRRERCQATECSLDDRSELAARWNGAVVSKQKRYTLTRQCEYKACDSNRHVGFHPPSPSATLPRGPSLLCSLARLAWSAPTSKSTRRLLLTAAKLSRGTHAGFWRPRALHFAPAAYR